MKKFISFLGCAFILSSILPQTTLARPLTEYNEENRIELNQQFYDYFNTFPEFHISENASVDHPYYAELLYLKNKNILEDWHINNVYKQPTHLEFVKIITPLIQTTTLSKNNRYSEVIEQHPDVNIIKEAIGKKIILPQNVRSFQPNDLINKESINTIFRKFNIEIIDPQTTATIGAVIEHIVQYAKLEETPYINYSKHTPTITFDKDNIYVDQKPFYGICANWLVQDGEHLSYQEIRNEILKMKEMGIRCISTEIGWEKVMPTEHVYNVPLHVKNFFTISEKEGMLVNLLLSPHYTPEWLFEKYSQEIRMVDIHGDVQDEGEYITYSLHSPAVIDQMYFQQKSIEEFSKYNNILSFLLSNEISYGRTHDLDYSPWAEQAWKDWLVSIDKEIQPIPREETSPAYIMWKRFRQISLNTYFNKTYRAAVDVVPRYIPVSHKNIPYEATSYFAPDYGLHPSPLELEGDIIATDIYGVSPNTYAIHHGFQKPMMVVETNLPGDWDAESMYHYLFMNFLHGIKIQSIFQWNKGTHPNVMFYFDGKAWTKTAGVSEAANVISSISSFNVPASTSAIILPTHTINLEGKDHINNHHLFDESSLYLFKKTGKYPMAIWIDDISAEGYYETNPTIYSREDLQLEHIIFRETKYDSFEGSIFEGHVTKDPSHPYLWNVSL